MTSIEWFRRWRRHGYKKLWYTHFGGSHEGDKGCDREYRFLLEVTGGWRDAYESERSLRLESETLLRDNGIEPPTDKRDREWKERMASKKLGV